MEKRILKPLLWAVFAIAFAFASVQAARAASGDVGPTDKWAWGTNIGWVNFSPTHGGVSVYEDHLEGYAWGETVGWIRLGSYSGGGAHTYANDAANTYGVNNDGSGNLSGYAWGTNIGWINFNPTHGGVRVDPVSGKFEGYAWGENVGWISFKGGSGANAYQVVADLSPDVVTLQADEHPGVSAQSWTLTATVSSNAGIAEGTVTFKDGETVLGTAGLVDGVASFTVTALCVGPHTLTAEYNGAVSNAVEVWANQYLFLPVIFR